MRVTSAALGFLLGSVMAVSAQTPAAAPPTAGPQYDVPVGPKPQVVIIGHGEIPAGQTNPIRRHPGVEMGYITQGEMELWFKDQPPHTYHPGEAFFIPPNTPYQVRVPGKISVILYNTFVVDKDAPRTEIVQVPDFVH